MSSFGELSEREPYFLIFSSFPLGLMFIYLHVSRQCALQRLSWIDPVFTAQGHTLITDDARICTLINPLMHKASLMVTETILTSSDVSNIQQL